MISGWAKDGLSNEQIAFNIGISPSTLYEWKKKYPEISEAMRVNKEIADRHVENAHYRNATGYDYYEEVAATEKVVIYDSNGKRKKETVKPVTLRLLRHKPAETTAQINWLKNRKPGEWSEKRASDLPPPQNKLTMFLAKKAT